MKVQEALSEGWFREVVLSANKKKSLFETLSVSLGLGEASSIAAAKSRGFIFGGDDGAARSLKSRGSAKRIAGPFIDLSMISLLNNETEAGQ